MATETVASLPAVPLWLFLTLVALSFARWMVYPKPFFTGIPRVLEVGGYPDPTAWGVKEPYVGSLQPLKIVSVSTQPPAPRHHTHTAVMGYYQYSHQQPVRQCHLRAYHDIFV